MKGLKKTFILALCLLACSGIYAQGARIVNTIAHGKPLSYWTYWDANEGFCPGPYEFISVGNNIFYVYTRTEQDSSSYCTDAWYKIEGGKITKVMESDFWSADCFYYQGKDILILGIVNSWCEEKDTNFLYINAEMRGKKYSYRIEQKGNISISSTKNAYFVNNNLFIISCDGYFVRIEFTDESSCKVDYDSDLFTDLNKDDYDIQQFSSTFRFAEWKYYKFYHKEKIEEAEFIGGSLAEEQSFDKSDYEYLGIDDKGICYYVKEDWIVDDNGECGVSIKYNIAVFDPWSKKLYFYEDYPLGDWNPTRHLDSLKGYFPWTLSPDGNIYFMDLDRRTNEYVIKKVDNLWEKDLKAKEKSIGTVTKNHIPLYKEASLDAENDGYNFENDFVWVKETKDNWSCIQKIDGSEGWIPSEYLRF